MALALSLGARGLGQVWPNPSVGCVIVGDGRIVGRGRTDVGGRPHGEVRALAQAGDLAKNATAYVTLEPCSHHGKTPPCADALIAAGIARVVIACVDPHCAVNGQGIARLKSAGVDVTCGVLEQQAQAQHIGFFNTIKHQRPFVTLKLASSFDGRIATATGESQWITGPQARRHVHILRARHDAVLVGAGTARIDDPMLNVRDLGVQKQPVRVVMSRMLDLPIDGQLARSAKDTPLWILHGFEAGEKRRADWAETGANLLPCDVQNGQLDPRDAMRILAKNGLTRVFCEGGGTLAAALLAAGLVDEMIGFSAGVILGAHGTPGIGALDIQKLADAPRFTLKQSRQIGPDLMHVWGRA